VTRPSHAALVEEVAKAIARIWSSENKNADLNQAAILFTPSAEAAIASVAARLSDVTPEMVEAWADTGLGDCPTEIEAATADWRAMLSASALGKGGKGGKE